MDTKTDHIAQSNAETPAHTDVEIAGESGREFPLEDWRQLATIIGYKPRYQDDYPTSVLDMYVGAGRQADYKEILKRVHDLGLFRDSFSSRTVDSLRAVMEMGINTKDTPLLELAQAFGESEVINHWNELRLLFGIHDSTSLATIKRDQEKQRIDRQNAEAGQSTQRTPEPDEVRQADRLNAGSLAFESQSRGGDHPWGGPNGWQ